MAIRIENKRWSCPRLGAEAHLTIKRGAEYVDESRTPISTFFLNMECADHTRCGVSRRDASGGWTSDWSLCPAYIQLDTTSMLK
jgi:hypothetical protein